ncbi:aldo/keto reductase [Paenibacillus sp. J5C_2022]|uniref:aldo/keto reductase n=1 Tax=Paenibacillus sp. J5C2022 TaxID=2977129 RepID=UPI0021CECBDD|nr:aldo/keto reductase [Paenibacillus sp. J5C2022]MCU6709595.1 aldo/keto reductase [Paenibacillus sp. J5C2022]
MNKVSMKPYVLPGTELTVSGISLGASSFGSEVDAEGSFRQLDEYVAHGGNFLDTARTYGQGHISERTLGDWMAERGNRNEIVLATKGGQELGPPYVRTLRYKQLSRQIDESLNHLRTDYIDLYYLHVDDRSVPVEEIIDLLNDKVQEGKIRYAGCSNWGADRTDEANAYAARTGQAGFVVSEIEYSLAAVNHPNDPGTNNIWMDGAMREFHRRTGLSVCAYSPQARGFFTKLVELGEAGIGDSMHKQYYSPRNLDMLERLRKLSAESGYSVPMLAIAYICHQQRDFVTIPVISCLNTEQLRECLMADSVELDAGMLAYLEEGRYE